MLFNRVKQSFIARTRGWKSRHFERTKCGKNIARYKGVHQGERCVVVGNGPSLNARDLEILHQNNVVTFGTNRVFHIFNDTAWRPTYYVSEDMVILKNIQNEIPRIPSRERFIPINLKWDEGADVKNASYFYLDYHSALAESNGLSLDASKGIRCRGTVTISCIQMAMYMGFSEIYLIGVDHNYSRYIDSNGNVVEDPTVKDYFSASYDTDFKDFIGRNLGDTTLAYISVEELSKELGTFKVFNATRGGKLEVFERVDFDKIFN